MTLDSQGLLLTHMLIHLAGELLHIPQRVLTSMTIILLSI